MTVQRTTIASPIDASPPAAAAAPRQAGRIPAATRADRTALGTLVGVQVVVLSIAAAPGFFNSDDFFNFAYARQIGLSWDLLKAPIFGHWAPGHRLADWTLAKVDSLAWWLAVLVLVSSAVVALVFLDRLFRALEVPARPRLAALTVFALSPLVVRPLVWFAAGAHVLPGLALLVVCLDGFVRYRATRRLASLTECVVGFAGGLVFYEIPLLLVGYLAVLALVLARSRLTVRAASRELAQLWPVWVTLAPIAGAYVWNYEVNVASPLAHPTRSAFLDSLGVGWGRGFVAGSFGLVVPQRSLVGQTAAILLTQLLLAAFVVWTVVRNPRAWRAWALLVVVFLSNASLVAWNRAAQFGTGILADLRYQTVVLPFLLLAAVLALRPTAGRRRTGPVTKAAVIGGIAVLAAYAVVAVRSDVWLGDHSEGVAARSYVDNARADLARLHRGRRLVALYDETVPFGIVPPAFAPYNLASYVIPQIDPDVVFDGAHRPRYVVGVDGHVRAAAFAIASVAHIDGSEATTTSAAPGAVCAAGGNRAGSVSAGLDRPLGTDRWFVRIHLHPGAATGFRLLTFDAAHAYDVTGVPGYLPVPAGSDEYVFPVPSSDLQRFEVVVAPGTSACITGIDFGKPVAN